MIKQKNIKKAKTIQKPVERKIVTAGASFVHQSPRKLRLVADAVRELDPDKAIGQLKLLPHRSAGILLKVFQQAMGNAKNSPGVSPGGLKIKSLQIEEGPRGPKREDVHAHGARYDRGVRRKRMAHIKLELISKE